MTSLQAQFGNIDIYLFDQLLKGRFDDCDSILDLGCGGGRNLCYLLHQGKLVYGIDTNPDAIAAVRELSSALNPNLPAENYRVGSIEDNPFSGMQFHLVLCNAVLHFAENETHFEKMLFAAWEMVAPDGYFFVRLASSIGIEQLVQPIGNGRYWLPDCSERYLVNEDALLNYTAQLKATLCEPIKTTNVQHQRCMTTWCLQK